MVTAAIRKFGLMQPFPPYAIHFADGRYAQVWHPDNAVLEKNDRSVYVLNSDKVIEVFSTLMIVSVRPLNKKELKVGK